MGSKKAFYWTKNRKWFHWTSNISVDSFRLCLTHKLLSVLFGVSIREKCISNGLETEGRWGVFFSWVLIWTCFGWSWNTAKFELDANYWKPHAFSMWLPSIGAIPKHGTTVIIFHRNHLVTWVLVNIQLCLNVNALVVVGMFFTQPSVWQLRSPNGVAFYILWYILRCRQSLLGF